MLRRVVTEEEGGDTEARKRAAKGLSFCCQSACSDLSESGRGLMKPKVGNGPVHVRGPAAPAP